jgi:hypothetical protein
MMTDTVHKNCPPPAPQVPPPKVRMDRSRAYGTVHGERGPNDLHAGVMYYQDGIPADASGYFLFDHPDLMQPGQKGDQLRKIAAKKIERQLKIDAKKPPQPVRAESEDDDEDVDTDVAKDEEEELLDPINLEAWLRGEQQVEWHEVSQEIARRFKKRIAKEGDAVEFLVKEGVVPKAQLRKAFQKYVD